MNVNDLFELHSASAGKCTLICAEQLVYLVYLECSMHDLPRQEQDLIKVSQRGWYSLQNSDDCRVPKSQVVESWSR